MNDQPSSGANTEQQSNVLNEDNWLVQSLRYTKDYPLLGFLQLCADRRFHRLIQEEFQRDANLPEPEDYWIHADAGGTPKMEDSTTAPNYCYHRKGVRLMGWSAHGATCGGFGDGVDDDVIRAALKETFEKQKTRYREARHFCYFVTIKTKEDGEETVLYSLK